MRRKFVAGNWKMHGSLAERKSDSVDSVVKWVENVFDA